MANKVVIHIFHADDRSLGNGARMFPSAFGR